MPTTKAKSVCQIPDSVLAQYPVNHKPMKHSENEIAGHRYGRLAVLYRTTNLPGGMASWVCLCDCGVYSAKRATCMRSGDTQSCGCYGREMEAKSNYQHGMSGTRTHKIWQGIISRCYRPNASGYSEYGGSGITVCRKWHSFVGFFSDMGIAPSGHSIDRVDGNRGYSKSNCRWATPKVQADNRKTTIHVTAFNETKSVINWSRDHRCAISLPALYRRLRKVVKPELAITAQPHGVLITELPVTRKGKRK